MPAEEKKLRSFGDLYDVSQKPAVPAPAPVSVPRPAAARVAPPEKVSQSASQEVSESVGQPTDQPTSQTTSESGSQPAGQLTDRPARPRARAAPKTAAAHLRVRPAFVPVSFKGDPAKVKALKLWALQNDQRLQDLFDQALTDLMRKLGITEDGVDGK